MSMATAFESFSIREYTSKMRTLDVVKTWPFGFDSDEVSKQTAEAFLPPITVTKFRWWSDELELLRSNRDKVNQIVNQEVEEEKEKVEKVCPVCRVFVASTVNAVNAHIDGCLAAASTEQRCQMKKASPKTKSRVPKKRSMADIFAVAPPIEARTVVEYENDESKLGDDLKQGEIDRSKAPKSRVFLSAIETIKGKQKTKKKMKKDRTNVLASRLNRYKKKLKNGKGEKLIPTKETHLQSHHDGGQSILPFKKRRSSAILNIVSTRGNKTATRNSSKQKKNKHFDKDEVNSTQKVSTAPSRTILKKKGKVTTAFGSPYLSLQSKDGEKFDGPQRSERNVRFSDKEEIIGLESLAALKEKKKSIEGDEEVSPFEARKNGDISNDDNCHDHNEVSKSVRCSAEKSSSMNEAAIHDKGYSTLTHKSAFLNSGVVHASEETNKLHSNVSKPSNSYTQLIDCFEDPGHASEKSSLTNSSFSIPSPSSAFSKNGNKRFSIPSRPEAKHCSEFFVLPLNSQGELIRLGPSRTSEFDQHMESRSTASSSKSLPLDNASDYRTAYQMHHIERELPRYNFNLLHGSQKMQLPVGGSDLEGIRRAEIQWLNFERGTHQPVNLFPPKSNSSPINTSFDGRRHSGNVQSQNEYHEYPTQQTMRLMGKDVAIGRSSNELQGVEGGKFWRNRENMIDYNLSGNQVFFQGQLGKAPSEIPRQALVHQSRFRSNERLQSNLLINIEHGMAFGEQNAVRVSFKDNPRPKFSPQPFTLQPMMSTYQNRCHEMYGSSSQAYKPNLAPSNSSLAFPFVRLPPYCEIRTQSPTSRVYKSLPPWISHSNQKEKAPCSSSRLFNGMNQSNFCHASPQIASRSPYNLTPSNSYAKNEPLFHSKFVPIIPASNTSKIKDYCSCNKTNKRTPAYEPFYPRKSPKLPKDCVAGLTNHSPNINSMARPGPVKLSAGTKHILKPSQNMDHDNAKSIYSKIPFAGFNNSFSFQETKKSS